MRNWLRRLVGLERAVPSMAGGVDGISSAEEVRALNAFYYEVAMMKLNSQFRKIDAIDRRSTSYFTNRTQVQYYVGCPLVSCRGSRVLEHGGVCAVLAAGLTGSEWQWAARGLPLLFPLRNRPLAQRRR